MPEAPRHNPESLAIAIVQRLKQAGHTAFLAGGCVRDVLLGRTPKDYDVATTATPDQVQALFPDVLPIGRQFGVMNVLTEGHSFEVATFRRDRDYSDGRRPDAVEFAAPEEDARRRDFTINGLFYDPDTKEVFDFVQGRADIEARVVRAIGNPADRFREDFLRMLRAVRFAAVLEFSIDPATADAIRAQAASIAGVSPERIQQELTRLLVESPRPGHGVRLLHDLGLLQAVLPEVAAMAGQTQPAEYHPEGDVLTHTIMMLDRLRRPSMHLAYAVLLHDVGKPPTAALAGNRLRFNNHAQVGADIAEAMLRRLRMASRDIEVITHCIRNHMRFMDAQRMRRATLRRLVGSPTFPIEHELHRLDCECSQGDLSNYRFLQDFLRALSDEPILPSRWITGKDLLALGMPEGPEVGRWLRVAYDAQIEGKCPTREDLLAWLRDALAQVDRKT